MRADTRRRSWQEAPGEHGADDRAGGELERAVDGAAHHNGLT
jgi:hypothetical protein